MDLIIVPWAPGPLIRLPAGAEANGDLRRRTGVPIDVSDVDVAALVAAYEAIWVAVPAPDAAALAAAHAALLETASLLRCAPPAGPAEREYVRRHRCAIVDLIGVDLIGADLTEDDPIRFLLQAG